MQHLSRYSQKYIQKSDRICPYQLQSREGGEEAHQRVDSGGCFCSPVWQFMSVPFCFLFFDSPFCSYDTTFRQKRTLEFQESWCCCCNVLWPDYDLWFSDIYWRLWWPFVSVWRTDRSIWCFMLILYETAHENAPEDHISSLLSQSAALQKWKLSWKVHLLLHIVYKLFRRIISKRILVCSAKRLQVPLSFEGRKSVYVGTDGSYTGAINSNFFHYHSACQEIHCHRGIIQVDSCN